MSKHKFQTEVSQLLQLIIHSLYSHNEIFLRELISNSSDALDKIKYLTLTDEKYKSLDFTPRIDISFDGEKKQITISDTGIGMNKDDLKENLGTIARSGTKKFVEMLSGDSKKDSNLIGQFGVGFYSCFMVADKVEVISKKAGEDQKADLVGADLKGMNLTGVDLAGVDLSGSDLKYAGLIAANLKGATFTGSNLSHANLGGANLIGADFSPTDESGSTYMSRTIVSHADLTGANLSSVDGLDMIIYHSNLKNANMRGGFFSRGRFYWSNLRGADLSSASIRNSHFFGVEYDDNTIFKGTYMQGIYIAYGGTFFEQCKIKDWSVYISNRKNKLKAERDAIDYFTSKGATFDD